MCSTCPSSPPVKAATIPACRQESVCPEQVPQSYPRSMIQISSWRQAHPLAVIWPRTAPNAVHTCKSAGPSALPACLLVPVSKQLTADQYAALQIAVGPPASQLVPQQPNTGLRLQGLYTDKQRRCVPFICASLLSRSKFENQKACVSSMVSDPVTLWELVSLQVPVQEGAHVCRQVQLSSLVEGSAVDWPLFAGCSLPCGVQCTTAAE